MSLHRTKNAPIRCAVYFVVLVVLNVRIVESLVNCAGKPIEQGATGWLYVRNWEMGKHTVKYFSQNIGFHLQHSLNQTCMGEPTSLTSRTVVESAHFSHWSYSSHAADTLRVRVVPTGALITVNFTSVISGCTCVSATSVSCTSTPPSCDTNNPDSPGNFVYNSTISAVIDVQWSHISNPWSPFIKKLPLQDVLLSTCHVATVNGSVPCQDAVTSAIGEALKPSLQACAINPAFHQLSFPPVYVINSTVADLAVDWTPTGQRPLAAAATNLMASSRVCLKCASGPSPTKQVCPILQPVHHFCSTALQSLFEMQWHQYHIQTILAQMADCDYFSHTGCCAWVQSSQLHFRPWSPTVMGIPPCKSPLPVLTGTTAQGVLSFNITLRNPEFRVGTAVNTSYVTFKIYGTYTSRLQSTCNTQNIQRLTGEQTWPVPLTAHKRSNGNATSLYFQFTASPPYVPPVHPGFNSSLDAYNTALAAVSQVLHEANTRLELSAIPLPHIETGWEPFFMPPNRYNHTGLSIRVMYEPPSLNLRSTCSCNQDVPYLTIIGEMDERLLGPNRPCLAKDWPFCQADTVTITIPRHLESCVNGMKMPQQYQKVSFPGQDFTQGWVANRTTTRPTSFTITIYLFSATCWTAANITQDVRIYDGFMTRRETIVVPTANCCKQQKFAIWKIALICVGGIVILLPCGLLIYKHFNREPKNHFTEFGDSR